MKWAFLLARLLCYQPQAYLGALVSKKAGQLPKLTNMMFIVGLHVVKPIGLRVVLTAKRSQ
jgi:hypothetical protein